MILKQIEADISDLDERIDKLNQMTAPLVERRAQLTAFRELLQSPVYAKYFGDSPVPVIDLAPTNGVVLQPPMPTHPMRPLTKDGTFGRKARENGWQADMLRLFWDLKTATRQELRKHLHWSKTTVSNTLGALRRDELVVAESDGWTYSLTERGTKKAMFFKEHPNIVKYPSDEEKI